MLALGTLLAFLAVVTAIPSPEIVKNSERLARNLPPLPPKFMRALPGYIRDESTPVDAARRSYPSVTPVSYTGRIEVRIDGSAYGYLANSKTNFGSVNYGKQHEDDLHVNIKTTSSGVGPFEIRALHPKWKGPDYIGAASPKRSPELSSHSAETVNLAAIEKTPRHSPPVHVTGGYGESTIWSIDTYTKELKAHWINPNESKPPTVIAYNKHADKVFFVGDIDKYNKENAHSASVVKFYLVPDS